MAAPARPRRLSPAGVGAPLRRLGAQHAGLHPHQPRRPGHPAGFAQLRPLVDPRRRHHRRRSSADGVPARRARVPALVRRASSSPAARSPAASTIVAPTRPRSTTATASSSTPWPSTTASPATSASSPTCGRTSSPAADYTDELREQRLTSEYESGDKLLFRGLLPESISHEGYSSNPVHSYWDDFFALRGLQATPPFLAGVVRRRRAGRALRGARATPCATISAPRSSGPWRSTASTTSRAPRISATSTRPRRRSPSRRTQRAGLSCRRRHCARPSSATTRTSRTAADDRIDWEAYTAYEVRNVEALLDARPTGARLRGVAASARRSAAGGLEPVAGDHLARRRGAEVHRRHAAHLDRRRIHPGAAHHVRLRSALPTKRW